MTGSEPSHMDEAELRARVQSIDSDVVDLKGHVENLGKRLVISHDQLSAKIDSQGEKIYAKIDGIFQQTQAQFQQTQAQRQTQWPVIFAGIGVLMTFCITIGGMAYFPIRSGIDDARGQITETSKTLNQFMLTSAGRFVNSNTFEGFAGRVNSSTQAIRTEISGLHEKFVGIKEHDRLLGEIRDARSRYLTKDVFDTRTHDVDRRVDGFVRRLERLEGETFRGRSQ